MTHRAAAGRYAKALFDVVLMQGDVEQVLRQLQDFADLVAGNAALTQVFANPAIPAAKKRGIVEALLARAAAITPALARLLLLLADRDRLVLLPDLAAVYRDRVLDHQNVIRGEVLTAVPLDADRLARLAGSLTRATGRQVVLEPRLDASIIGGVVTQLGSTVFDGSIRTQLRNLRAQLVESGL
ncbi:MAG TPA: ATP synthase F1 subunit delta [Vicinamibacterales bacterium]|nr:ATP synthase F1 subunit delta [Vicinamibacterales bacterium]